MRKEYVEYMKDLPIDISLVSVLEYPIHWQDTIQVFFVLRGAIDIGIENEVYRLEEREIEIINANEVYSIRSDDKNNLVLILKIDPNFFEKFYDDAKEVFYYTDSSDDYSQDDEKYHELRKYISILLYEAISKLDDYEDQIEEKLLELMYYLLNNFHYLYYEGEESLKEDEEQLARYHRIVKYLSNNYMDKVSLQEIADKEYLTSQYLSFKIKYILGQGFNDYLNQIRVEESIKLLIDTEMSISAISDEVGFSHVRYYNKHFKTLYNLSPMQYRKKYKISEEEQKALTKVTYYKIEEAFPYLTPYIQDYERYNYDNKTIKIEVNMNREPMGGWIRPRTIDLGDMYQLLEEENRILVKEIQREIKFKYGIIRNLFSEDMDIYMDSNHKFINWTRVENTIDFLREVDLSPLVLYENIDGKVLEDFVGYFSKLYGEDAGLWLKESREDLGFDMPLDIGNKRYDLISMATQLFFNYIHQDKKLVLRLVDEISKETIMTNETFFGGNGIYTSNYLKKPSYYGYMFLSILGDEILDKGDGYIVTRSDNGYEVLLYNPIKPKFEARGDKVKERKVSLNMINLQDDFQVSKYVLNKNFGSVYDKWEGMNKPERLDPDKWELLNEYVHPNISFFYGKKSLVYNIFERLVPYEAVLYIFTRVGN